MNQEKFDREWREVCTVHPVSHTQLDDMIRAHYLGKWPAVTRLALGMFMGPFVVGMIVYADAPPETSRRYGGYTWELARLWIKDSVPRNGETWLISQSIKYIKRHYPGVCFLVSYADPSAGHVGTVYKAANWREDGRTDDNRKTPRFDYANADTGKRYSRAGRIPAGIPLMRIPRVSKYRYVYPLGAQAEAARCTPI